MKRKKKASQSDMVLQKALGTSDLPDFLPTPLAMEIIDNIRDLNFGRQLFREIKMPAKTFNLPKKTSGAKVYYATEGSTAVETGITSGTVQMIAKKLMSQVLLDTELIEDSQPDIVDIILEEFSLAAAEAEEMAFMEGDPSHTPLTNDESAATSTTWYSKDARLAFKGIFTYAGEAGAATPVDAGGNPMTTSHINEAIYRLGKYGRNKGRLVCVVNSYSAYQLREDSKINTVDKYGPAATITTGQITNVYGVPVVESGFAPEGKAIVLLKESPVIGDRRLIKIRSDEEIATDQMRYVVSERLDFVVRWQDALCLVDSLEQPSAS